MKGSLKERREITQRKQHHEHKCQRVIANGLVPERTAHQANGDNSNKRQSARIDIRHIARQRQLIMAPDQTIGRPPIISKGAICSKQIGNDQGQKGRRRQRAARCAIIANIHAYGLRRQGNGEGKGDCNQKKTGHRAGENERIILAQALHSLRLSQKMPEHIASQSNRAQISNLIAANHHKG